MLFELTDEHLMIQSMVREFSRKMVAPTAVVMSVHNSIVCESILIYGTEKQKQQYLPSLISAEIIGAFALTEPHAGSDPVSRNSSKEQRKTD